MTRLDKFNNYKTHPWLKKSYNKLTKQDHEIAQQFLQSTTTDTQGVFEHKLNRLFLDKEKPKNINIISELLSCCNS